MQNLRRKQPAQVFLCDMHPASMERCRGAACRSRRGTSVGYRLALKWKTPPPCHCEEAAGRRGNLGQAVTISPMAFPRCCRVLRDSHVASLLGMTNLEALHGRRRRSITRRPPWRSLTAATDAIGRYVFSAAGTGWKCLPEIATGARRPRNDKSGVCQNSRIFLINAQIDA